MTTLYDFCLQNNKEYLLLEWNYTKNEELTPQNITTGSNKKVWWKCSKCGYEWKTSINCRVSGNTGCIMCHKYKNKNPETSLAITHPEIACDWNYSKNGKYTPNQFRRGSNFHAWWKCSKCGNEIYRAIHDYRGCPKCKTLSRIKNVDLLINNKGLMTEWDYELNKDIDPTILSKGSNKKVWWICSFCKNKWQTQIYKRAVNGAGCPKCRHHKRLKFCKNDNLLITHPEIAKDWHPNKNGKLKPEMFTKESKYKIWWKCHICGEEIFKEIRNYSGHKVCKEIEKIRGNNLATNNPNLVKEWNYNKNGELLPEHFANASNKKVWWKCHKCGYEWQAKISNRTILNRRCPCCSNRVVIAGINDLATTHPEIAKEWHPTKNKNLTPQNITHGNGKKVWWLCPLGHEYQATVLHRTQENGTACPVCNSGRQTSFAEQTVFYYVKKLYSDAINRYTANFLGQMELDIYIPSINYAIEYDGEAWHKGDENIKREIKKYKICKSKNIKLIRLRENVNLYNDNIADIQICREKMYEYPILENTIKELLKYINFNKAKPYIDVNIKRDKQKILQYKTILNKNTLQDKYPNIAKEWHHTKNKNLRPNMFKPRSDHKVWWLCPVCGYEYEATIGHRTASQKPTGCPKCGIEKSTQPKRKAVNMIDPNSNKIIKTFISISDASKKMKINDSNISMVCKGIRPKAGGYIWSYVK